MIATDSEQRREHRYALTLDSSSPLRGIIVAPTSLASTHSLIFANLKKGKKEANRNRQL